MSCNQNSLNPQKLLERIETLEKAISEQSDPILENTELVTETEEIVNKTEEKELTDEQIVTEEVTVEDTVIKSENDEPKRENYECPLEFHKAFTAWIEKKDAETPVTKSDLKKFVEELKTELLKAVPDVKLEGDLTIGEAIKKSAPVQRDSAGKVDYNAWLKSATAVSPSTVTMEAR